MLQRAATSAYSWWWASHIRTKQSKWLEQNLHDVEDKVQSMLKIIEQDGDSFAKRAEMYYKKRPELITFVEETFRAYRALAERYDHLSKDLQSANRTIASVFPEQVQLGLESDDDDSFMGSVAASPDSNRSARSSPPIPKNLPKAPKLPRQNLKAQSMLVPKREQLRKSLASDHVGSSSGLSKEEALREIDSLQKEILGLQTEKEFVKTSYESGLAKFTDLENKVTELQSRVYVLQDEFGIGTVIEDHEARTLMASSALQSCASALAKLQEEQERSIQEVKAEYKRIKEAQERLEAFKEQPGQDQEQEQSKEQEQRDGFMELLDNSAIDAHNVDELREKLKEQLKKNFDSSFTKIELAEKIDDLVEKIVDLETSMCSQNALVQRLRREINELLGHIRTLEEDRASLIGGSPTTNRLKELEEELNKVKGLNNDIFDQKNKLDVEITEAGCNVDHLQEKLHHVDAIQGVEYDSLLKEAKCERETEPEKEIDLEQENSNILSMRLKQDEEEERLDISQKADSTVDTDMQLEEEDGLNWRQLYLNNIEDREKILVEEYTLILRDYKDIKRKLNEAEKKNCDSVFELASHARELRTTIAAKDREIQLLRQKLSAFSGNQDKNVELKVEESEKTNDEEQKPNKSKDVYVSHIDPDRKPLFHHLYSPEAVLKSVNMSQKKAPTKEGEEQVRINLVSEPHSISRVELRFREELNNLLEANLDFWLRFSTSFHQIQKFQNSIKDLQAEISKLKETQKQGGSEKSKHHHSLKSDARALYKHMREIQTELTLWLEHSVVFQEELRSRFSSLDNIQYEITKETSANCKDEENELSDYQAAKFHGEVVNMKQENSKVAEELQAGVYSVKTLKTEIERTVPKLDKEFGFSESKSRHSSIKGPLNKPRIPLQSFLFGVKLPKQKQKQSFFACVSPAIQRQHSDLSALPEIN